MTYKEMLYLLKNKIYNHLISQGYSKEKVINIINTYDF